MKRILFVAPASYPVNGPEAIVNFNLLRLLIKEGEFKIDLISKKSKTIIYPDTSSSLHRLDMEKLNINIVEVNNKITVKTLWQTFCSFIKFGVVFIGVHWAYEALKIAKDLVKYNSYDYVLTKSSPSFLIGWYMKKVYHTKWVASWNDPFPEVKYPAPYGEGRNCKGSIIDRIIISKMKKADIHIFPNERLRNYMLSYLKLKAEQCLVIPHVIPNDIYRRYNQGGDTLKIVHTGNLGKFRNPMPIIEAFRKVRRMHEEWNISLTFIGKMPEVVSTALYANELEGSLTILPSMDYEKCIKKIADYTIAAVIEAPVEEGIFLPTKVGDFISVGIPIYALSPKVGVLNDMYKKGEIPYFSEVNNVDEIFSEICNIYKDFVEGELKGNNCNINDVNKNIIKQYLKI